jgi:carbonic anhydrase
MREKALMPKDILHLIDGYKKFKARNYSSSDSSFQELVKKGQRPKVLMIACSDSRVDPAIVMDCEPGDLFVVRNVANLIPPYENDSGYHGTSAALEFGVCHLGIRHIVVLGHTQCGGIKALVEGSGSVSKNIGFISKWMEIARPAYDLVAEKYSTESLEEKAHLCGHYSLINSFKNLHTFPWIKERVEAGQLFLHAWCFDLATGVIQALEPKDGTFKELV